MEDKKRYGSQVRGNGEGYQGNGGAVELTQNRLGCGMGKEVRSKAPIYDTYGKVEKIVHGHQEVGEKI